MNACVGFVTAVGIDLDRQLRFADRAGFDYVEILMDGPTSADRLAARTESIRERLAAGDPEPDSDQNPGLGLAVHLPFPVDIGSPYDPIREGAVAHQRSCLDVAADLGAKKAVLHPEASAWDPAWEPSELRPHVEDSVAALAGFGAERSVEVCVENLPGSLYTIDTFDRLLDATGASMTLDTGHARITGYDAAETAAFAADHADRISHVHLNDNRTASDEHLPLGAGTVDLGRILDGMPADWTGTLSIEVATESLDYLRHSKAHVDSLV